MAVLFLALDLSLALAAWVWPWFWNWNWNWRARWDQDSISNRPSTVRLPICHSVSQSVVFVSEQTVPGLAAWRPGAGAGPAVGPCAWT